MLCSLCYTKIITVPPEQQAGMLKKLPMSVPTICSAASASFVGFVHCSALYVGQRIAIEGAPRNTSKHKADNLKYSTRSEFHCYVNKNKIDLVNAFSSLK